MAYATKANLIARFGEEELTQLTDRADPAMGAIDDAVLTAAMSRADALVDSYLRVRYTVPLSPVPAEVAHQAEGIARRYLYDDGAPEGVQALYDEAIAWLKDCQAGRVLLDAATTTAATGTGSVGGAEFAESVNDFAEAY